MIPGDEVLYQCNESELLWMARVQGLPILRRGIPKEELVAIVAGEEPKPEHLAWSNHSRERLERFIQTNLGRTRSFIMARECNGMCRTFKCTEEKHLSCFLPNENLLT